MPTLHNRERDMDYRSNRQDDREISLGTGTILGIFFALALLCAVFFGFGYSMGRKSAQPTPVATATEPAASGNGGIFSSFKPSAGSPAGSSNQIAQPKQAPPPIPDQEQSSDPDSTIVTTPVTQSVGSAYRPKQAASPAHAAVEPAPEYASEPRVARPTEDEFIVPKTAAPHQAPAMPLANPNGTTIVQIAAVSHQEDADVLLSALKKRGYAVFVRNEPQDHLLHVQVGPFATRKDADAMRQRLLSDGYNAIVK